MTTQDPTAEPQPVDAPGATPLWLIALRVVAVLAPPLVATGALVTFAGVLGAGRHGSAGGAMFVLFGIAAAAAALPLAVFAPRHWPSHQALHVLGALATVVGSVVAGQIVWEQLWVPSSRHQQFDRVIATVQMGPVRTEPLVLDGVPIGLRTTVVMRLREAVPLDDVGRAVLRLLASPRLRTNVGATSLPFGQMGRRATVRLGEQVIDPQSVQVAASGGAAGKPEPLRTLPAGEYTVEFDTWHWGLDLRNGAAAPCRSGPAAFTSILPQLASTPDIQVHV